MLYIYNLRFFCIIYIKMWTASGLINALFSCSTYISPANKTRFKSGFYNHFLLYLNNRFVNQNKEQFI